MSGFLIAISSFNPLSVVIAVSTLIFPQREISPDNYQEEISDGEFTIYRQAEFNRITASLLANGAILIVGEEGSGKSVLANAVFERLIINSELLV